VMLPCFDLRNRRRALGRRPTQSAKFLISAQVRRSGLGQSGTSTRPQARPAVPQNAALLLHRSERRVRATSRLSNRSQLLCARNKLLSKDQFGFVPHA
jgi:hypothetical protein